MNVFKRLYTSVKEFFISFPAALSGYIIYLYLFFVMIKFFLDEKEQALSAADIFQRFDSLLWMWLLSVSLVKIIDIRSKLFERQKEQLIQRQQLEVNQMQLSTLVEIVRGLQHEVNNPLTIIMMNASKMERQLIAQEELRDNARTIRDAADRIAKTLDAFSRAKRYEVDTSPVGNIAKPPDMTKEE